MAYSRQALPVSRRILARYGLALGALVAFSAPIVALASNPPQAQLIAPVVSTLPSPAVQAITSGGQLIAPMLVGPDPAGQGIGP